MKFTANWPNQSQKKKKKFVNVYMYPYADLLIDWNWLNCFVNISSYYKKWVRIEWILLLFIKAIWAAIFMGFFVGFFGINGGNVIFKLPNCK